MNVWIVTLTWLLCGVSQSAGQLKCPTVHLNWSGVIEYNSTINGGDCIWKIPAPDERNVVVRVNEMNFRKGKECRGILSMPTRPEIEERNGSCAQATNSCWIYRRSSATCTDVDLSECSRQKPIELPQKSQWLSIQAKVLGKEEVSLKLHYHISRCLHQPGISPTHVFSVPTTIGYRSTTSATTRSSIVKTTINTNVATTTVPAQRMTPLGMQKTNFQLGTKDATNIEQNAQETPKSNSHSLLSSSWLQNSATVRSAVTGTNKRSSIVKSKNIVTTTDSAQLTTSMEPQTTKIELATNGTTRIEQNDAPIASSTLRGSGTVETRKRSRDTRSREASSNVAYIVVIALLGVLLVAALIAIVILGLKLRRVKATAIESASNGVHPVAAEEANGKIEATAMAELVESVAYGTRGGEEVNAYATVQ